MSQLRPKGERVGEIAAKAAVQLLFSTGKSFTVDGLREKLREFFRQEVRAELRAVAALNWQLALVGLQLRISNLSRIRSRNPGPAQKARKRGGLKRDP